MFLNVIHVMKDVTTHQLDSKDMKIQESTSEMLIVLGKH